MSNHHCVGNISNRRLGYLEQACERYAMMAYEVLRRELAMGFKSITYAYRGSPNDLRTGTFTATMIPWNQTDAYRHGHRSTEVSFDVCAVLDEDQWTLSKGQMRDIESGMRVTIRFNRDGRRLALNIPEWDEIRFASNADHDQNAITSIDKEPWENLYDSHTF